MGGINHQKLVVYYCYTRIILQLPILCTILHLHVQSFIDNETLGCPCIIVSFSPAVNLESSNDKAKHNSIVALVEQVLSVKKSRYDSDTNALEEEINQQVYALYGLTPAEIAIVEEKTKK